MPSPFDAIESTGAPETGGSLDGFFHEGFKLKKPKPENKTSPLPLAIQARESANLSPDFTPIYQAWKADPSPATNLQILNHLKPTISSALRAGGFANDPLMESHAKIIVLDSLPRYDPAKSKIETFLNMQLQGLKRLHRKDTQVLSIPERMTLESAQLLEATNSLEAELGRPPSDAELMDHLGISRKRLAKLRTYRTPVSETQFVDEETGAAGYTGAVTSPWLRKNSQAWTEIVYDELDPYHQKVMELTLGLNGQKPLSNQEIARMLRRSPGAISQAKARIQAKLDEEQTLSPFA